MSNPIVKALRTTLDADPSNWEVRHALIEAHLSAGQTHDAHQLLNEIESLPDDEASLVAAAQSYGAVGALDDAAAIAQSVLAANPANAAAHLARATIADRAGDSALAIRHYITATSLDPDCSSPGLEEKYGSLVASPVSADPEPEREPDFEPTLEREVNPEPEPKPEPEPVLHVVEKEPEPDPTSEPGLERAPETVLEDEDVPNEPEPPVKIVALTPEAEPPSASSHEDPEPADIAETADAVEAPEAPQLGKHLLTSDSGVEFDEQHLREIQHQLDDQRKRAIRRDKLASLSVTVLLHVAVLLALALVVIAVPQAIPPQITARHLNVDDQSEIKPTTVQKTSVRTSSAAPVKTDIVASVSRSNIAMSTVEFEGMATDPTVGLTSFEPSMSFSDTATSMNSKMMFGQKMEGEVLGVILDVSGSMAEYLPLVIREVDKNFEHAPIVYVNHAQMLGATKSTEIYPIVAEEVMPRWPKEWNQGTRSPYWFLWHDLPRKAPQKTVDRLIGIFKERPNMFIARGGNNRVGAAAEFLIEQKCDSLYIFSDWEDFVDQPFCEELGQILGRNKVRTYVQPAAARTEHLHVVAREMANRTKGREMPPLTTLLRPEETEQVSLLAALEDDEEKIPPPEGVSFATVRTERDGPGVWRNYGWWDGGDHAERFGTELKVVEYENFDIVMVGPEARAFIYLKTPEGYIQNPIIFGYHSHKPYLDSDDKWRTRRRKWLRNVEEPAFDGKEFKWHMILEDEIEFQVIFWFKEDSVTGTYIAEKPPEGESDGAFIYFRVPPLARESKDRYFSVDFPGGLTLDDLRTAMTYNYGNFYLPALAADRMEETWNRLGFSRGDNLLPYNIMYRTLPDQVREVTIMGPSFGPRKLQARTINNNLLLNTHTRADMELWEGFLARLTRPSDRRERLSRAEAIEFSVE